MDGLCASANYGFGVVRNGGVICARLSRYGERGTVYVFVCFVVEDDTGEVVFPIFAVVGDGEEEGIKCFLEAY